MAADGYPPPPPPPPSAPRMSVAQLRDAADALRQPLADRRVLLPLGARAFRAARLRPTIETASGAELVTLRSVDGESRQMTRVAARELLEEESKALSRTKKPTPVAAKQVPHAAPPRPTTPPPVATLPFIDIREEIDEEGRSVSGEAFDVSRTLRQMTTAAGAAETAGASTIESADDTDGSEQSVLEDAAPAAPRCLDDGEYAVLAARLDELARLEEQADQEALLNRRSRTKLVSQGWSKGFLNKATEPKRERKSVPVDGSAVTADAEPRKQATGRKSVSFSGDDPEVREIPRIGDKSIKETQQMMSALKQPSGWSKGFLNNASRRASAATAASRAAAPSYGVSDIIDDNSRRKAPAIKTFEEHVVSSVIQEHVATSKPPQEAPQDGERKLSRFAQRRLEAQRNR